MTFHHTKNKGDIGLCAVILDLTTKGYQVALPISEHQPWDCIAVYGNKAVRLSVRFRSLKNGCITDRYRSQWVDLNGIHYKDSDKNEFDATAVFCPDTNCCYYFSNKEVVGKYFTLRIIPDKRGNSGEVCKYTDPSNLFKGL